MTIFATLFHTPKTPFTLFKQQLTLVQSTIQQACERSGRLSEDVRIIAITKTHPINTIMEAYKAGHRDFGENKVQELLSKAGDLPDDIRWHMVGTIQTNKIKDLVHHVHWIHSISKIKQLKELEKRLSRIDRHIRCLIQINISDEGQKSGCSPEALPDILEYATGLKHITVEGLMGMAAFTDDHRLIRQQFRLLRDLRDSHRHFETETIRLKELSMGMSGDFDMAIEEGATLIRLGSTLFGSRSYS